MKVTVKVEGLRELDKALGELPKATARSTLVRVLRKAAVPIQKAAELKAPKLTNRLAKNIVISTKLSRREKKRFPRDSFAEVHVGPHAKVTYDSFVEFGTDDTPAQPFMRPAWEQEKENALAIVKNELGGEIEKARLRIAKKTERLNAKGSS